MASIKHPVDLDMMGNSLLNVGGLSGVGLPNKQYNVKLKVFAESQNNNSTKIASVNVIIENYDNSLNDNTKYRLFSLRWRNGKWKSAFLSQSDNNRIHDRGWDFWSITGRESLFLGDAEEWGYFKSMTFGTRQRPRDYKYTFKSSRSTTLKVGCAIYKYTGEGTWGWQRVSNIAYFQLHAKHTVNDYRFSVHQE